MNKEKYLPIGTVVLLKNAEKRLMIMGYCPVPRNNDKTVYDYCGCLYPEGLINSDEIAVFNHDQIENISYLGFTDEESNDFMLKLKEFMNNNVTNSTNSDFVRYEENK